MVSKVFNRLTTHLLVLGMVARGRQILRGGAKTGDAIFVTGELGGSRAGRHLEFEPRLEEARWLAEKFQPNKRYTEAAVNALIQKHHWDSATLRRELIGYRMLGRESGIYWRQPEAKWLRSFDDHS